VLWGAHNEGLREKEAEREEFPKMDARLAELTVRKWQTAKARALGATHDMEQLPEVLLHLSQGASPNV
jgi:hypothetical protein